MPQDLHAMLRSHGAALGDSPAAVLTSTFWTELCERPPFDAMARKLDEKNKTGTLLAEIRDVVDAVLQDMSAAAGGGEPTLDAHMVGSKRKKAKAGETKMLSGSTTASAAAKRVQSDASHSNAL